MLHTKSSGAVCAHEYPASTWHPEPPRSTQPSFFADVYARLTEAVGRVNDVALTVENISDAVLGAAPKEACGTASPAPSPSHTASVYEKLSQLESSIGVLVGQVARLRAL